MGIRKILGFPKTKESQAYSSIVSQNLGQAVWTDIDQEKLIEEGYKKCVVVYSCIKRRAKSVASVPIKLYSKKRGKVAEIEEHPLLNLINKPNPTETKNDLIEKAINYKLSAGNSYLELNGERPEVYAELNTLRPERMTIFPSSTGIAKYVHTINGIETNYPVNAIDNTSNILHLKEFDPLDDFYGMGIVEACRYSVDLHNGSSNWNKSLLDSGGTPNGVFRYKAPDGRDLQKDELEFARKNFDKYYRTRKNKPLIIQAFDYVQTSLSPKDMDFLLSKDSSARDIALAFNFPPVLLGIQGDSTYNNQAEAKLALWEDTIIPDAESFVQSLNNWLTVRFGDDLYLQPYFDDIPALAIKRKQYWDKINTSTFMTINEKREALKYEPIVGGDTLYISSTLLPLDFDIASTISLPDNNTDSQKKKSIKDNYFTTKGASQSELAQANAYMRLQAGFVRTLDSKALSFLENQTDRSAEIYEDTGDENKALDGIEEYTKDFDKLIQSTHEEVATAFGESTIDSFEKAGCVNLATKAEENDAFINALNDYLKLYCSDRVTMINETTKTLIKGAIIEGINEGGGRDQIAKKIRDKSKIINTSRSKNIATTEIGMASNWGSHESVKSLGFTSEKKWIASSDERARTAHVEVMSEDYISIDEKFNVDGDKMEYPCDPAGGASNCCNCRCVTVYRKAK
jgi:HK97 family phage portal protein